ncbi:MAG: helix-turn-helix transcriptional regulator [Anaerotignum sp.]|nr:helix-turn-helix transcriptional regulator [Anaerotignum sp.]
MSDFAKYIRKFRKQKGYSQTELAKKLNYGYTAIANYESGRNEPSRDVLIVLADTLGVTVDELLGWSRIQRKSGFFLPFRNRMRKKR